MNYKLILVTCILSGITLMLPAQDCLPEGIRFATQSDIDSFPVRYPGCTTIEGDVCIGDCDLNASSDITNLDSLIQLTSIMGKLSISRNPILTSLKGLRNLEVLEDDVLITYNWMLSSLEGLNQVRLMRGEFSIEWNEGIDNITGFEMLDTIAGTLSMTYLYNLTSVAAFSNLKYLGGYKLNGLSQLTSIPDMNNLEYLGDFMIQTVGLTDLPEFPMLSTIHGNFHLDGNFYLPEVRGYENINRITGDMVIEAAGEEAKRKSVDFTLNAFHNLNYVGGRFGINVEMLDTLDGFTSLDSVGGEFHVNGNNGFHTFPQDNQFKYFGSNIGLGGLPLLEDLDCLSTLERIHGGLSLGSCPNLNSLSAIGHFTEFGGGLEFQRMDFTSLADLANLDSIGGSLRIYDCNSLTNLAGLEGLTSIDGHIFIFRNQHLASLEGIQHISPQTIRSTGNEAIIIHDNPRLEVCNVESICEALRGLRKSYSIENNAPGCDDITEIVCKDYGLSGKVFFDENQNQLQDTNEVGIPGIPVRFQPGDLISPTNADGWFFVPADSGEVYTMTIEQTSDWILTTDSLSYTSTFEEGSPGNADHFFGLHPAYDWIDLSVDLTSNPIRCNQNVHFFLHWLNESTRSIDGRITLQYDSLVTFVSALVPPSNHNPLTRELTWTFDSLALFTGQDVRTTFKMPDETFVGQEMNFTASAYIDSSGTELQIDLVAYTPTLECAVDPNDKLVMPPGIREKNYTLKDAFLTYTIRFENLGNAEAIDITILDTLDTAFDMNTFKVVHSSAPVFTTLRGHEAEFFFQNIWLDPAKTGFVTYAVKPLPDVPDITPVKNQAGIVFDLNQPIFTNTTLNTLVYEICEDVSAVIDTIICRGEEFLGFTEPGTYYDTIRIGSICDSFTEIHLTVLEPEIFIIDTSICEGESFYGYDSTGMYFIDSLNLETGCNDIIALHLEVIPLGTSPCITGTEEIGALHFKVYPNPVQHEIHIEAAMPIESVRLFTIDGRPIPVEDNVTADPAVTLHLNNDMSDGFYLLAVTVEGRAYFKKVVVIR